MQYSGLLTKDEVKKFIPEFYELEHARATKVDINPDKESKRSKYLVILTPEEVVEDLLEVGFKSGLLNHWGWAEKFKKSN